jgi:aspartate dehydrogenase
MKVALIGFGAIARSLYRYADQGRAWHITAVIASQRSSGRIKDLLPDTVEVVTSVADLSRTPEVFVECAGHDAVAMHGHEVLRRGKLFLLLSVGALTDDALFASLQHTAAEHAARIMLPTGAMAGIDGLAAARQDSLRKVTLTTTKQPCAWQDTPAAELLDLENIHVPTRFYSGTARCAARDYPKNANVAATVSLAGLGFDRTDVHLIADPTIKRNRHKVVAEGEFGRLEVVIENETLRDNPKTSMMTVLSILRQLDNISATLAI